MSTDELTLLDALFDRWLPPSALVSDGFSERLGLRNAHGLSRLDLDQPLASLRRRRLIKARGNTLTVLSLSARGGAMWSTARRPQWTLYCGDSQVQVGERWILRVRGVDRRPVVAFIDGSVQSGLYAVDQDAPIRWKSSRMMLTPWKRIEGLSAEVVLAPNDRVVDWTSYERGRTWWRTVDELQTLVSIAANSPDGLRG